LRTVSGTAGFLAPELLGFIDLDARSNFSYTTAVDIWAVGEITFRMLSGGEAVFQNLNELRRYVEGRLNFPSEELYTHGVGQEAYSFTKSLMTAIPNNRPSAVDALEFDWIKSHRNFSEQNSDKDLFHHTDATTDLKAGAAQTSPEKVTDEPWSLPVSSFSSTSLSGPFCFNLQEPSSDDEEMKRLFNELARLAELAEPTRRRMLAYHQDKLTEWQGDQTRLQDAQLTWTMDGPVVKPEIENPQLRWVNNVLNDELDSRGLRTKTEPQIARTGYVFGEHPRWNSGTGRINKPSHQKSPATSERARTLGV
jgi:serine/threonine protein kinase